MQNLSAKLIREMGKGVRKLRAPKGVRELPPKWPVDFSKFTKRLCNTVGPYTMTSKERVAAIERAVRYICDHQIEGDFVECGVGPGGSVMAMMLTLLEVGDRTRHLWLYDTFEGMPKPGEHDTGRFGTPAVKLYDKRRKDGVSTWVNFSVEQVQKNLATTAYPAGQLHFVKGMVEETLAQQKPLCISLLRLDTDWYDSHCAEIEHLFPLVATGGVILLDDYFRYDGARKAVDDYTSEKGIRIFWARIDTHAVIGIKQTRAEP
ncbi:MAG: class I SAM-dependent methyltransferase [Alphaproteobacteria bacterium]|nr:class I SAM-dependent methyltransferase [Alphaproteobacteria bacterium]